MWFLLIAAFFIFAACVSIHFNESMCDVLPVTGAGLILFLYTLGLFGALPVIFPVACIFLLVFIFAIIRSESKRRKLLLSEIGKRLVSPATLTFIVVSAAVTFLTKDQIFSWWDDINFWSSDAKQIFYLNGFPGKYGNVSPEFGDYPPVTSLFKWIFLQLSGDGYKEGLQFSGYYVLSFLMLLPLVKFVEKAGKKLLTVLFTLAVFMIPGIVNGIVFYGTPADITMGLVYGALLCAIWDREGHTNIFYFGRIAVYTSVLFLTKSVGIEWAVFALIFWFLLYKKDFGIFKAAVPAALFYGSWLLFCLINRRVAKVTGLGIKMATGSYAVPANAMDKARYFFLGLWTMPMHADHNITFDLPIGGMFIVILAALVLLIKKGAFKKGEAKAVSVFFGLTFVVTYGLIFVAHVSLFQSEDQYLDAFAMTNSIARYGAPFILGCMYLLIMAALKWAVAGEGSTGKIKAGNGLLGSSYFGVVYSVIVIFILLTADYTGTAYGLHGYRATVADKAKYNSDMIDEGAAHFLETIDGREELWGHRVLNIRSSSFNHWVHDTYLSKEASPVPVIYETLMDDDTLQSMTDKIVNSHAQYLYVEPQERESLEVFDSLMKDGKQFSTGHVYKIERINGGVILND